MCIVNGTFGVAVDPEFSGCREFHMDGMVFDLQDQGNA